MNRMEVLAEGLNAFDTDRIATGVVTYLANPAAVIALIDSGGLQARILLVRGGTTTFLAPALSMGALGVITMSGAPESHLGILAREFQIPCVMTVHLTKGTGSQYVPGQAAGDHFGEIVAALDGARVRLDCSGRDVARVLGA